MGDDQQNLSVRLYETLEMVGASEEMRQIHNEAIITEIMESLFYTVLTRKPVSSYICGSWCEGTTTPGIGSDVDYLLVHVIPVNNDIIEARYGQSFLMVQEANTQPGYFKLQLVYDGVPLTVYQTEVPPNFGTDRHGRVCLKHIIHPGDEIHGPANTSVYGLGIALDKVFALRCARIPDRYTEWIHRKRKNGWPSKQLLDRMAKLSCFVVGVGHERSDERDIEWRLSFSLQERELMLSLNPVQHKCYILIKLIKKDIIQPFLQRFNRVDDVISSYHCKTCLFHAIESSPPDIWTPENLIPCLFRCLDILIEKVNSGNCPNYFISGSNMFDRDVFRITRGHILQILEEISKLGYQILFRLKTDNVGSILAQRTMFDRTNKVQHRYHFSIGLTSSLTYFQTLITTQLLSNHTSKQNIQFLLQLLDCLQTTACVLDHTENQTQEALSNMIPWIHQRLAMALASVALEINHGRAARQLFLKSDDHFRRALATDLMSTRLMFVTVLYKLGKYKECEDLLEKLDLDLTRHTLSICPCGRIMKYAMNNTELANKITDKHSSMKQIIYSEVVSCITFLPSEINIVPPPLHYEMRRSENTPPGSRDESYENWFDWAVVDAKVFLFFMQYLVFTKLGFKANKEVAVQNLEWVMTGDIIHRDTAYNLLGWIHLQEHRLEEALGCWGRSLAIRPQHNAAKFHVSDLMYNIHAAMNG